MGLWKNFKTRVQKTSSASKVKKNVLTYMWEDKKTRKSEKTSPTAQQPIPSHYSTFCGRSGWWCGRKTTSRRGLCLRVGTGLTLRQDFSAVGLHERRLLRSLSVGQGWTNSSPVRHCDAGGEGVWCRFLPDRYWYAYILGRMGARVRYGLS